MVKRFLLISSLLVVISSSAQADSIKLGDALNKLPVKEG